MLSQVKVDAVLDAFASWNDDKKAEYGVLYRESHSSSSGFQEMNLKLPIIGVLVYCVSELKIRQKGTLLCQTAWARSKSFFLRLWTAFGTAWSVFVGKRQE